LARFRCADLGRRKPHDATGHALAYVSAREIGRYLEQNRASQLSVGFQFAARIEAEHYARAAIWGTLMLWDARELCCGTSPETRNLPAEAAGCGSGRRVDMEVSDGWR
jgi:hypothetical protein